MIHPASAWLLAAMTQLAPPDRLASLPQWPGYEETADEKRARYALIADDFTAVAFDPAEAPAYGGPHGRKRTAALLIGLAYMESGFARDVDIGPCYSGKGAPKHQCDGGRSACMLQLHIGTGTTRDGWTQADLFADRQKCVRAALDLVRRSFRACAKDGPEFLLNGYTGGVCHSIIATVKGRERLVMGRRVFDFPGRPTAPDAEMMLPRAQPPVAGPVASFWANGWPAAGGAFWAPLRRRD